MASALSSDPARDAPSHVLVVGGTGMLAGVSLAFVARGATVSVVARSTRRLAALAGEASRASGRIEPLAVDYRDGQAFLEAVEETVRRHGRVALAVAWIHGTAPEAPYALARALAAAGPCRYVHVLGSAAADPSRPDAGRRARFASIPSLGYVETILGFVREGARSRWLTDAEIVRGVLEAAGGQAFRHVVGTVEPWTARPGA